MSKRVKALPISESSISLFDSLVLALLYPLNHETLRGDFIECVDNICPRPEGEMRYIEYLKAELNTFSTGELPHNYLKHLAIGLQAKVEAHIQQQAPAPETSYEEHVRSAIEAMFNVTVKFKDQLSDFELGSESTGRILNILRVADAYQPMIEVKYLPDGLALQLCQVTHEARNLFLAGLSENANQVALVTTNNIIKKIGVKQLENEGTRLALTRYDEDHVYVSRVAPGGAYVEDMQNVSENAAEVGMIRPASIGAWYATMAGTSASSLWSLFVAGVFAEVAIWPVFVGTAAGAAAGAVIKHRGIGSSYAKKYEETLTAIGTLINSTNYPEARQRLNELCGWNRLERSLRNFHLRKSSYAQYHFYKAYLLEQENNRVKAYGEYLRAYSDARSEVPAAALLCRLHMMRLLKDDAVLQAKHSLEELMDSIAKEFNTSFQDLYSRIIVEIRNFFSLVVNDPLTQEVVDRLNLFLKTKSTSLLSYYAKGYGSFTELYLQYTQAMILIFCHNTNDHYITLEVKRTLSGKYGVADIEDADFLLLVADAMLKQVEESLNTFTKQNENNIRYNMIFNQYLKEIKDFVLTYACRNNVRRTNNPVDPEAVAAQHGVLKERAEDVLASVSYSNALMNAMKVSKWYSINTVSKFLANIKDNYATFSNWVHDGNSVLHWIVRIPKLTAPVEEVKSAAELYKGLYYKRDNEHKTPLNWLEKEDPYKIRGVVTPEKLLPLHGTQEEQLAEFIEIFSSDEEDRSAFLLLDGPSGTGKTSMMRKMFGDESKYQIATWINGTEDDKFLHGVAGRITSFFNEAFTRARWNTHITQIISIERIDSLYSHSSTDESRSLNADVDATLSQCIEKLKTYRNVLLIATSDNSKQVSSLLSNAFRIVFDLPSKETRDSLFKHLFSTLIVPQVQLDRITVLSAGWTLKNICGFITRVTSKLKKHNDMTAAAGISLAFSDIAKTIETVFHEKHKFAVLRMPKFIASVENSLGSLSVLQGSLLSLNQRLSQNLQDRRKQNYLLTGPAGNGKSHAVMKIAADCSVPVVTANCLEHRTHLVPKFFEDLKLFDSAVLFIDEIDTSIRAGSELAGLFQVFMADGNVDHNVYVLGATNKPEKLGVALLSRVTIIDVPYLDAVQMSSLLENKMKLLEDSLPYDDFLNMDKNNHYQQIASVCSQGRLSIRDIEQIISTFYALRNVIIQSEGGELTLAAVLQKIGEIAEANRLLEIHYESEINSFSNF